jgi:serine/threonine protein kinase/tetratricopeptide (TPR) repeat protein
VDGTTAADTLPSRIGHYAISHKLGQGGMGVVYAARDERLQRPVALKMISSLSDDETTRRRFWREARIAASVNHPNICQIYDIGDDEGDDLFIAMELLEGETLDRRLQKGPLSVSQAVPVALDILAALAALHARGVVHRDLKPSNVFLTPHGVKVLDFGVARPQPEQALTAEGNLTGTGVLVGTPRYIAPECVLGEVADARSDLFAVGAILFEILAGRPAFAGRTVAEVLRATVSEQPPALIGPPAVTAVDRVIRRALSKRPDDRPESADEMARQLRGIRLGETGSGAAVAQVLTRLVVLPFRALRPDPESDFLAFSLPDAIATSLSGTGSLVVRSSAVAARFAGEAPDLKALAAEADVDRVVTGTLLRSGDQVRASVQLIEAPAGTLLASLTVQSSLGDLFRLQDDISRRVVQALSLPLVGQPTPTPDVPRDAQAYELYLRANELASSHEGLVRARDLYERCLALDPNFAPAWAHLGRCHRAMGKYIDGAADSESRAEHALGRALELNPRLAVAQKFYAHLEADMGRAQQALVRLLTEAHRHGNDPELFAGLVHACRYCGLYEASVTAHAEASRLDPNVRTSVAETLLMAGETERLQALDRPSLATGTDDANRVVSLGLAGRREEAFEALARMRRVSQLPVFQAFIGYLSAWLERRPDGMALDESTFGSLKIQHDPEAVFLQGWLLCELGEHEQGLPRLQRAVASGYLVAPTLAASRHFDPLRHNPQFRALLAEAEAGRQAALTAFRDAGGERLLGLTLA